MRMLMSGEEIYGSEQSWQWDPGLLTPVQPSSDLSTRPTLSKFRLQFISGYDSEKSVKSV